MISFKEALQLLEKSNEYKNWRKENPEAFLSYGFFMVEEKDDNWKIGYYHKEHDKITSFNVGDNITIEPETEIFKKEETEVKKLDLENIKLDLAEAVSIATNLQREEYATENPTKVIAILQNIEKGQVWNITFLTQNFNTINFKIKAETGRVIEKKITSLMEFRKT